MSDTNITETRITDAIIRYLRQVPGCWYVKVYSGTSMQRAGLPDLLVCCRGRFIALEVKSPTGRPTKLQQHTLREIVRAGGTAAIVRSVEEARMILEKSGPTPCHG